MKIIQVRKNLDENVVQKDQRPVQEEEDYVEEEEENSSEENDYVGHIDVKRLQKFENTLPVTKNYDLIIIHSSLLSKRI